MDNIRRSKGRIIESHCIRGKNNSTDLTTSYYKQSAREAREVNENKRPQLDKLGIVITITLIILLF